MSVAYFVVLDKEDVQFDTFVNGKAIAHAFDELTAFCNKNNLNGMEDFVSQNMSEFMMEEFGDIDVPEQEEKWFDAKEGVDWINALIDKLKEKSPKFFQEELLEDLTEYREVFQNAEKAGAKWHLEFDV